MAAQPTAPDVPAFSDLLFEADGPVARLTLNRPAVTNTLSIRLSDDLTRAVEHLRDHPGYKLVVIRGAGGNFCAGDDLTEMGGRAWGDANQVMRRVRGYQHMAKQLEFTINRGVECDQYTAQGFEAMGAALTDAVLGDWEIPDADGRHGWPAYRARDPDDAIRRRREATIDFWTE